MTARFCSLRFIAISELVKTTLQRQNTEISKQIFPEKEYRGLSPNFHIHASVSYYILPRSVCLFCWRKYVNHSWDYINRSQTHECGNWGWGRAIPRKGIHKWGFSLQCIEGIDFNKPKYKCRLCSVRSTWQQTWCIMFYCTMYSNIWYCGRQQTESYVWGFIIYLHTCKANNILKNPGY